MDAGGEVRDWWDPLAESGGVAVTELLAVESLPRYFAADQDVELELARLTIAGEQVEVGARWQKRFARYAGTDLVELDLSGAPDPTGGYDKALRLGESVGSVVLRAGESRRSRLRGALRFLQVEVAGLSWVWHFEGGRAAGERLVLSRGHAPGEGPALVTTYPAARGRSLGNPTGGATVDTHVTSWAPEAGPGDVVLAELLATARLDALVDYRPSRSSPSVAPYAPPSRRPRSRSASRAPGSWRVLATVEVRTSGRSARTRTTVRTARSTNGTAQARGETALRA